MSTERQLRRERERKAEEAGEGQWRNAKTNEWCAVDVTFYPTTKLWITECGKRRNITRAELDRDYRTLEI